MPCTTPFLHLACSRLDRSVSAYIPPLSSLVIPPRSNHFLQAPQSLTSIPRSTFVLSPRTVPIFHRVSIIRRHLPTTCTAGITITLPPIDPRVFRTTATAVARLLVTIGLGVGFARRGVLDEEALSALSKCVYWIFLPAVLLTKVCRTIANGVAGGLLFLPVAAALQVCAGLLLGRIGGRLFRLRKLEKTLFSVCCAFGNSAALPLLLADALFGGAQSVAADYVACISFFLLGWSPLFWGVAYGLLANSPDELAPELIGIPANTNMRTIATGTAGAKSIGPAENLASDTGQSTYASIQAALRRIFSPPIIGSCLGLFIGLVAPLRTALLDSVLFDSLDVLGRAYAPVAVLVLAGSLARRRPRSGLAKRNAIRWKRIAFGVTLVRFVAMPLLGLSMVRFGGNLWTSPTARLALMLESTMPAAQNSVLILKLEGKESTAAALARILFAVYVLGIIPISFSLTAFMQFAGL